MANDTANHFVNKKYCEATVRFLLPARLVNIVKSKKVKKTYIINIGILLKNPPKL